MSEITIRAWFELLENVHPCFILPWEKEIIKEIHPNTKRHFPIIVEFQSGINNSHFHYKVLDLDHKKYYKIRKKCHKC